MKFCINCAHYRATRIENDDDGWCEAPHLPTNVVTGKQIRRLCSGERNPLIGQCKSDAVFFLPRESSHDSE